ncbi:MAG: nicotinate-nucleotide adenylyltransferase [Anaerolineae bacterium]|nr:nicotinate-nucleotide adenylyltransferase [Anaerolineae bacterium]
MRLGIFGGTFDPPHLGHLILASEAFDQLHLDRVLWVLTPDPPHKQHQVISSLQQRLQLVQAAINDNPTFELSCVDINRQPPYYAADTVRLLAAENPCAELFYLVGGDSLHNLPTWYAPETLLDACDGLGVMRRPGDQIDLGQLQIKLPEAVRKLHFIDSPLLEISSKQIRERIFENRSYRYFLPESVYQLIIENGYYQ